MSWLSSFLFLSFLSVTIVLIQPSSSTLTNDQKKLKSGEQFSFLDTISSITGNIEENVNELRCPEKWSQIRYSCYLLSDYMSMAIQANHTCDLLHLNNSRLMYIQESVQLMYAAHVLIKNNLNNLMLEVDEDLMQGEKIVNMLSSHDRVQWEEFGKKILQDKLKGDNEKTESSKRLLLKHRYSDDNTVERESTTIANDEMNNENKDQNKFENVNNIRKPCDEIKWNVTDKNSNILIFTVKMDSNKSICSLSNANLGAAYLHLCQYVLDRCLNNIKCGKHGRCVNSQTDFNCSCSFLYDGLYCKKFSIKDIQLLIAFPIVLISPLLLIKTIRDLLWRALKRLLCCFRRQRPTSSPPKDDQDSGKDGKQSSTKHSDNDGSRKIPTEFVLSQEEQLMRSILVVILSIVFFSILIGVPVIRYVMSAGMNNTNLTKFDSPSNDNIHIKGQYGRNTIFRIENLIFLIISIVLSIVFSFLNTKDQSDDINQSTIIEPIKLFYITDRFKTVAIIMIQMFEILEILDETLIDISEASQSGILVKIFKRMLFIIINALRYYPVFTSLQFQDIKVRSLTFVYVLSMMVFMIIRDSSHIYWLSFSKKIALLERINLHMDMNLWSFVYSFAKNCLYWVLIGYIGAELTMRLFYDSMYIARKNGGDIGKKTYRKIEKYAFSRDSMKKHCLENSNKHVTTGGNNIAKSDNSEQLGRCSSIQKCIIDRFHQFRIYITEIVKSEDDFRFTTIIIATYAIAFIFLFHLACNLIFLYTTEKTNYITYLKHILERILNIEIKEQSFKGKVVFSAIITMIIYGLQLLHSIKNYKDNVRNLYNIYSSRRTPPGKPNDHEIIPKSVQYPAFILRYLLGGFVICFNLILFIVMMSMEILTRMSSFKWTLISIISVILVYGLHQIINLTINKLFTSDNSQDENDLRLNRPYSILVHFNLISTSFIGVISSIIRLITSVLVNILFMPRIDYSCFVQPLQTLDSAHMAFQCFIHWEFLYTRDILLSFSPTTKPPSNSDIEIHESTGEQQHGQDDHLGHQNMGENRSYDAVEIILDNNHTGASTSKQPRRFDYSSSPGARRLYGTTMTSDDDELPEARRLLHEPQDSDLQDVRSTEETSV